MGRLKKFPVKLVPNLRTYIVRLAALAVSAEHPLSNGKKMEIMKTQTLLKIPSLRPSRLVEEKRINKSKIYIFSVECEAVKKTCFLKPATAPTRSLNETVAPSQPRKTDSDGSQGFSTDCSRKWTF